MVRQRNGSRRELWRAWCSAHQKARETESARARGLMCSVEGCERKTVQARAMCAAHVIRTQKHGDPMPEVPVRDIAPNGEPATYDSMHNHLKRMRGPASSHACSLCGGQARAWAYIPVLGEEERWERRGTSLLAWSPNPERYIPLCSRCHYRVDLGMRRARAAA